MRLLKKVALPFGTTSGAKITELISKNNCGWRYTLEHTCPGLNQLTAHKFILWVTQAIWSTAQMQPRSVRSWQQACVCGWKSLTDTSGPVCAGDVSPRTGAHIAAGGVGTFSTVAHSRYGCAFVDIWNENMQFYKKATSWTKIIYLFFIFFKDHNMHTQCFYRWFLLLFCLCSLTAA